jgi:hypothetical protein
MGHIGYSLGPALKAEVMYLAQQQGKYQGNQEVQDYFPHGNVKGIKEYPPYFLQQKHILKIFQAYPGGIPYSQVRAEFLKGHYDSGHRQDIEKKQPHKPRD